MTLNQGIFSQIFKENIILNKDITYFFMIIESYLFRSFHFQPTIPVKHMSWSCFIFLTSSSSWLTHYTYFPDLPNIFLPLTYPLYFLQWLAHFISIKYQTRNMLIFSVWTEQDGSFIVEGFLYFENTRRGVRKAIYVTKAKR